MTRRIPPEDHAVRAAISVMPEDLERARADAKAARVSLSEWTRRGWARMSDAWTVDESGSHTKS